VIDKSEKIDNNMRRMKYIRLSESLIQNLGKKESMLNRLFTLLLIDARYRTYITWWSSYETKHLVI